MMLVFIICVGVKFYCAVVDFIYGNVQIFSDTSNHFYQLVNTEHGELVRVVTVGK